MAKKYTSIRRVIEKVFRDNGYIWRIFGKLIPIPVNLFFGSAYIEERPIDENRFGMIMLLEHPLFGVMFRYNGIFILEDSLNVLDSSSI